LFKKELKVNLATMLCITISSFGLSEEAKVTACNNMPLIVQQAQGAGFDPSLIASLIYVESRFEKNAVSKGGACGLMQLIPKWNKVKIKDKTIKYSCKALTEPKLNIRLGIIALKRWLKISRNNMNRALCGYNAGIKCIEKTKGGKGNSEYIMRDPTTFRYVKAVRRIQRKIDRKIKKFISK
tara:strand:- start:4944 stop:5489 length:546 start_codon:yes stop_codon:yes gene_type:complete